MTPATIGPAPGEKVCPYCAETIRAAAIKCRYCGSELEAAVGEPAPETETEPETRPETGTETETETATETATGTETETESATEEAPGPDGETATAAAAGPRRARLSRLPRFGRADALTAALVLALVLLLAAGALVVHRERTDGVAPDGQVTSEAARALVMDQAAKLTATALSYSAATFDKDAARAGRLMTDDMRQRYLDTLKKVRDQVRKRGLVLKAQVVASSVVSATTDSADVLEFVNQTTTAKGVDRQQLDQNRVVVTLTREGDRGWVIARLQAF